jgi:hypothetical protein
MNADREEWKSAQHGTTSQGVMCEHDYQPTLDGGGACQNCGDRLDREELG